MVQREYFQEISRLSYVFFCYVFSVTRHQILLVSKVVNLVYTYLTRIQFMSYRDLRIRWCHLSTIPGTTPHCLVSTGGDVNCLGTRNLVQGCPSCRIVARFGDRSSKFGDSSFVATERRQP